MRYGVVGSRTFTDSTLMEDALSVHVVSHGDIIVSGGAKGADSLAEDWADDQKLDTIVHLPDVERYGWPAAAFERNSLIVEDSDELIAFFGPGEPPSVNRSGTMDTVRKAIAKRIPVHLYFQPPAEPGAAV